MFFSRSLSQLLYPSFYFLTYNLSIINHSQQVFSSECRLFHLPDWRNVWPFLHQLPIRRFPFFLKCQLPNRVNPNRMHCPLQRSGSSPTTSRFSQYKSILWVSSEVQHYCRAEIVIITTFSDDESQPETEPIFQYAKSSTASEPFLAPKQKQIIAKNLVEALRRKAKFNLQSNVKANQQSGKPCSASSPITSRQWSLCITFQKSKYQDYVACGTIPVLPITVPLTSYKKCKETFFCFLYARTRSIIFANDHARGKKHYVCIAWTSSIFA